MNLFSCRFLHLFIVTYSHILFRFNYKIIGSFHDLALGDHNFPGVSGQVPEKREGKKIFILCILSHTYTTS